MARLFIFSELRPISSLRLPGFSSSGVSRSSSFDSQPPIFSFMCFFRPPGPAPAFFPAYFERRLAVSISTISAFAIATSVCRESLRMRAIMLSDSGPAELERMRIAAFNWWRSWRRFCGAFQAKNFEGVLVLPWGRQACLPLLCFCPTVVLQAHWW